MFGRLNSTKLKTQCQLAMSRVKLMRNKKQLALKQTRKEVAELLRNNKEGNARIRVETVIREALMLQAYDILELFLELLAVRVQLLEKSKQIPPDMLEALSSIVYASNCISDIPELIQIRSILGSKFGKEFVQGASSVETSRMWHVNENLLKCLAITAPEPDEKLQTLSDIAQEYGVEWNAAAAARDILPPSSYPGPPPPGVPGVGGMGGAGMPTLPTRGSELPDIETDMPMQPSPFGRPPAAGPTVNGSGPSQKLMGISQQGPDDFESPLGQSSSLDIRTQLFGAEGAAQSRSSQQLPSSAAGGFQDVNAAASAAREYSRQAQEAADAAERLAKGSHGGGLPPPGRGGPGGPPPGGPSGGLPLTPPGGAFAVKSPDEIQRQYDAVPTIVKPASAPSAGPPAVPPQGPLGAAAPDDFALPPVPPAGPPAAGQGPHSATSTSSDLDELQKRLAALKRG